MPNATAMFAVQQRVYETINVSAVTSLAPVFDEVTEGQGYPYIEIGEIEEELNNIFGKNGRSVHVTIHIFSDAGGYLEVEKIVEQLNILLDDAVPNMDSVGWKCWLSEYEKGELQKEFAVREIRHAIVRYHFEVTQP